MGVTTSKSRDVKVGYKTPKTQKTDPDKANRVLTVDPRSPTMEIVRTPIQVEQTPDPNSRNLLWSHTKPDSTLVKSLVDEMLSEERDERVKDPEHQIENTDAHSGKYKKIL